ncbi:MAG: TetR/AcrR family transcriptional regulator [Ktedonobacterales bacterium]
MARRPAPPGVDRREQILEAALDVFAEEGFDGATTKEIAARADVTHGLIYFYFPSKDDLFNAAFEHQAQSDFARLDFADERDSSDAPEEILRRVVVRLLDVLGSPRSMRITRMMMRMSANRDPDTSRGDTGDAGQGGLGPAHEAMHKRTQAILTSLTECLRAQMARGALRSMDPQLAAELLLGSMVVTMVRRFKAPSTADTQSPEELADAISGMWAHGLVCAGSITPMREKNVRDEGTIEDEPRPEAAASAPRTVASNATRPTATTILLTTQGI